MIGVEPIFLGSKPNVMNPLYDIAVVLSGVEPELS